MAPDAIPPQWRLGGAEGQSVTRTVPAKRRDLSPERNDFADLGSRTIGGPCFHQITPLVEQVPAPVCRFGLVLDHMGKCSLANLIRKIGTLC